ncbi:MAG: hypothetical protein VB118_12340 [Oscillospiraceae bacterium]|nr:hypothetical protein [Oscillospiraceae bacterium]
MDNGNEQNNYKKLKKLSEAYFKSRIVPVRDKNGAIIQDMSDKLPYTVTGYCCAIGLSGTEEITNINNPKCMQLVKRSLLLIESYAEERLFNKDSFSGAKLFLEINFPRWSKAAASSDEESDDESLCLFEKWGK